jgi:predicted Zn-dependent peptidase
MKIQTSTTKNKYKILHVQKESPISFILFLTKNGSRYESKEKSGISHFIEHMMFKPTKKRTTSKEINTEIESIGGITNAFTSFEYTGYYIQVLKEHFDHAFEILSDITQNGIFDEADIELEKGVVVEEIRMYEDSPSDLVGWIAQKNIFPDQQLGAPIIGVEETVKSFTRDQLIDYIHNKYMQDDYLIVSAGDFDISKTEELTERYLETKPEGTLEIPKAEFKPANKIDLYLKKDSSQAHTVISFPGISTFDKNITKYDMVDMVLGGGLGSVLFDLLREKLGVAYYVSTNHSDYLDTGVFEINFGANFDKTKLTVDKIFEELEKIKKELISEEELHRAQTLLYSHYAMSHESIKYLGQKYGLSYLLKHEVETLEEQKEKIFNVTREDILEASNSIFGDNFNITYIANKKLL